MSKVRITLVLVVTIAAFGGSEAFSWQRRASGCTWVSPTRSG